MLRLLLPFKNTEMLNDKISENHNSMSTAQFLMYLQGKGSSTKKSCNWRHGLSAAIKLGTPEPGFFQFGPRPDQKMVGLKKVAID